MRQHLITNAFNLQDAYFSIFVIIESKDHNLKSVNLRRYIQQVRVIWVWMYIPFGGKQTYNVLQPNFSIFKSKNASFFRFIRLSIVSGESDPWVNLGPQQGYIIFFIQTFEQELAPQQMDNINERVQQFLTYCNDAALQLQQEKLWQVRKKLIEKNYQIMKMIEYLPVKDTTLLQIDRSFLYCHSKIIQNLSAFVKNKKENFDEKESQPNIREQLLKKRDQQDADQKFQIAKQMNEINVNDQKIHRIFGEKAIYEQKTSYVNHLLLQQIKND